MNPNFYKKKPGGRLLFSLLTVMLLVSSVFAGTASAQVAVTGKVTSSDDGSALPGVNVYVKGTQLGTITDSEGKYSLSLSDNNSTILSYNQALSH